MNINEYFENINYEIVKGKIKEFDNLNFDDMSDYDITKKIIDIFSVNNKICNPIYTITIPSNKYFCRIRKNYDFITEILETKQFNQMCIFGSPKPNIGRMNKENEKGLYLSDKFITSSLESNLKDNEVFTCGIFNFNEPLNIILTYVKNKYYEADPKNAKKAELLNDFLYKYLKMTHKEKNSIYRITNIIIDVFSKIEDIDGLFYSSSKGDGYNIFIKNGSAKKCNLSYIFTGKYENKKIILGEFIKITNGKIVPNNVNDYEKKRILKKIGLSMN